jgi:hypothetical protein
MKTIVFICCFVGVMIVLITACSKKRPKKFDVLNYDDMFFFDAEDLAEGGIASMYKKYILPVLRQHVTTPAEIAEEIDAKEGSYKVTAQGKTYVIYAPGMDIDKGQNWGNATFALFDIVNRQLQDSPYRFYAINGGNDLGGMFLTRETYDRAVKSLKRKTDWPYLPTPDHPWYGQPHDE